MGVWRVRSGPDRSVGRIAYIEHDFDGFDDLGRDGLAALLQAVVEGEWQPHDYLDGFSGDALGLAHGATYGRRCHALLGGLPCAGGMLLSLA